MDDVSGEFINVRNVIREAVAIFSTHFAVEPLEVFLVVLDEC
jgi:hypothetical protein